MLLTYLIAGLTGLTQRAWAGSPDLDNGDLDNAGSRRISYHMALLGAEAGIEHVTFLRTADLNGKCMHDRDCYLALHGIPASAAQQTINMATLPCPDEGCDTGDLVEVYSQSYAWGAKIAFARALLLIENYGRKHGQITLKLHDDESAEVMVELQKWTVNAGHSERKLKHQRQEWIGKHADTWFDAAPASNYSEDVRGSVLLESLFNGKHCSGDSYLCPVGKAQRDAVKHGMAVLWGMAGKHVLDKNNPAGHQLKRLKAGGESGTKEDVKERGLQKMVKGADIKNNRDAEKIGEKFLEEARLNSKAGKNLAETMRYSTEVFDPMTGRIWHSNLRLDLSRELDPGLKALGYLPWIAVDDTGFPMPGHEQTRIVADLMPVTSGNWKVIGIDQDAAPNVVSGKVRRAGGKSLGHNSMFAPVEPLWQVPTEGGHAPDRRRISRRDTDRRAAGFLPEFRVFQTLVSENGGVLTDSMGLPIVRSVDAIDGKLATNPIIQSVDGTPIKGGKSSLIGLRFNGAKGDALQNGAPLQFYLDRESVGANSISSSKDHVSFPAGPNPVPVAPASGDVPQFSRRQGPKLFERWGQEKIEDLSRFVKSNAHEIGWVHEESNGTELNGAPELDQLLSTINEATSASLQQVSDIEAFYKGVDKNVMQQLLLGNTPEALRKLEESARSCSRLAEVARAKRAATWVLHNVGEGVASRELNALADALRVGGDGGFSVKALLESRGIERAWYAGLVTTFGAQRFRCPVAQKTPVARNVRRGEFSPYGMQSRIWGEGDLGGGTWNFPGAWQGHEIEVAPTEAAPAAEIAEAVREPVVRFSDPLVSGVSLAAEFDPLTISERVTAAFSKVPRGAIGWSAFGVMLGVAVIDEAVHMFRRDHSCPRPKYRTEIWDAKAAAATTIRSPCTHDLSVSFPTATASQTMTIAYGFSEATGGVLFNVNRTSYENASTSGGPVSSNRTWTVQVVPGANGGTHLNATAGITPSVTGANGTAHLNEPADITPSATDANATTVISLEIGCPQIEAQDGYMLVAVGALPCPVPTPVECGRDWFHQHVDDIPVGVRAPKYCFNGDLVGHARAVHQGCWPDFLSKDCKKAFGLDQKWGDKKMDEIEREKEVAQEKWDKELEDLKKQAKKENKKANKARRQADFDAELTV